MIVISRDGAPVPFATAWAEEVEHASKRTWLIPPKSDPTRAQLLRVANKVRLSATEEDPVPWDLGDLPMAGVSRARARLIRDTLSGYPVRFRSVNDDLYGRDKDGTLGVFETIMLEGDYAWGSGSLSVSFDMIFATSWDELPSGPACGSGLSRVLGIGSLASLEVLSMDPFDRCEQCWCWRPRNLLVDVDRWMLDDKHIAAEYSQRLYCKECVECQ